MGTRDPRVDAYIEKAADFAKPILNYIREAVHKGCPEINETLKWSMPSFTRKGIICGMAAFKAHCVLGFWVGEEVVAKTGKEMEAMGQYGRITNVKDLPPQKILVGFVKEAARLDELGVKRTAKRPTAPRPPLPTPDDLALALKKNKKAATTFENFSPSHRREYIEWITEAKRPETRAKRLEQTIEWLAEGKSRNWKYANC